jgi:outer membrane receptor protein involved in Fe transport
MGSAYETFRAPTLNELYRSFRVGDVLTLANDTLDPERLRGIEAGVQYAPGSGVFLGKATLFHMEVRDPIVNVTLDPDASPILRERRNLGRTVSEGCDLAMDVRLSSAWSATLGALFTHAVVAEAPGNGALEGNRVPLVPEQQATLQVRYGGRFFEASAQARWSAEVFDDDLNTLPLASAFTLDGRVSLRISEALEAFLAGENLLDERVEVARTPVLTVGPPRTWRAGLRIHTGAAR